MDKKSTCSGCQKPLPEGAPDELCPECLLQAGLGTGVDMGPDSQAESGRISFVAPPLDEVARLFPQLEVMGFIGQGGMGAVYKARQRELERVVALKILPPGIGKDVAFAERFTREAKALAKLNHTGIVTLYEFGKADGLFFFLMEFVDGMSLRHLLEVERISAREALAIVPQICDALQYAHDQGIVHRDIKPENILLDRQGRVKVADFGLAKLVGTDALTPNLSHPMGEGDAALTDAGKVMGTPQYMAPEQREHPTEVDHRADIYSLGVVFYQMLTGELPGKPIEAPSRKVQVDVRLDEVVLRALEKEPQRRYQQVSQVKTAVETIAESPPTDASPQPADWRTWSPFQSPQVREICARMTEAERREATLRGTLFGIWNAATFFLPCGIAFLAPKPLNWIFAPAALLLGLAFYPLWQRIMREFLVSTVWARQQGIAPGSLQMSPRIILVGRRSGQAAIHWPGVLLAFLLILVLAEAGAIFVSAVLTGAIQSWAVGIAFGFAVVFMGMLVLRGRMTPVEKLTSLDGPGGTAPSPARPAASRRRLRAALIVGILVWLFVIGTVTLLTWIRPGSWKVVAVISCPHKSQPGRPMSEHFKHTAAMMELIRSDVILGRVIDRLQLDERLGKLDERWGKRNLGLKLTKPQALDLLKRRLDVRSEGGTLIQVGVLGKRPEEPEQAMDIANTIAEELRAFRIEQHDPPAEMLEMTLRFTLPKVLLGLAAGLVLGSLAGGLVLWRGKPSKDSGSVEASAAAAPAAGATTKPAARERPLTLVGVQNGQRAIHWPGLILFAALLVAAAEGLSLVSYKLLLVKPSLGLATGLLAGFILLGLKLKRAWTTPVERLPQLATPSAPTRPQEPPIFSSRSAKFSLAIAVFGVLIVLGAIANFNFVLGVEKTGMLICGAIVLAAGCIGLALAMHDAAPLVSPGPPGLRGDATRWRPVWHRLAVVLLITVVLVTGFRLMRNAADVKVESIRQAMRGATERRNTLVRGALSQGEIQLVGISYHPSTNQPWWRPDGSPCLEGPFELQGSTSSATVDSMTREFVIRLTGLPADASEPVWRLDRGSWAGSLVYVGGQLVPDLQGISATVPKSARAVTVKAGIGMGAWETVANQVPGGSVITSVSHQGSNWEVSFPKAEGGPGGARILVTHTVKDWETRVLAVDTDGKEHPATGSESSGTDAFTTLSAKFPDLPLERVKECQFQIRPYQWVEFREVAMNPKGVHLLPNAGQKSAADSSPAEGGVSARGEMERQARPGEAGRVKLEVAEKALAAAKVSYEAGKATLSEYLRARLEKEIAEAEWRGDTNGILRANVQFAEAEYAQAERKYPFGQATIGELDRARLAKEIAEARLAGDAEGIARAELHFAERELFRAEAMYKLGKATLLELDKAHSARIRAEEEFRKVTQGVRYKRVPEAGESVQNSGGGPRSRTFVLRHRLASEMADDLRQIHLGRAGMEARPAPDNMQLTVTAPPDVLNRVSTFVFVADWPKRIAPGPDYYYPREDVEQAGRSFFYACSIEDIEGVTRMLAPGVLAELKGTNLSAHGVVGEERDVELVRQLRDNWEGKKAAVGRLVQAWNRFPLRRLQVEGTSISFGPRYFASAAFEGAAEDWVRLSFIPDRTGGTNGPLMIDTLPPWFGKKEVGLEQPGASGRVQSRNLQKETWRDAGAGTPEAALETLLWAAREKNTNRLDEMVSLPDDRRDEWYGSYANDVPHVLQSVKRCSGVTIEGVKYEGAGMAAIQVAIDGIPEGQAATGKEIRMILVNGVWKCDYRHDSLIAFKTRMTSAAESKGGSTK